MTKQELQKQLDNYRVYFNKKWNKPYPSKGTMDYLKFQCDVLKGQQMVLDIKKIEAGIEITTEDLSDNQIEDIFK